MLFRRRYIRRYIGLDVLGNARLNSSPTAPPSTQLATAYLHNGTQASREWCWTARIDNLGTWRNALAAFRRLDGVISLVSGRAARAVCRMGSRCGGRLRHLGARRLLNPRRLLGAAEHYFAGVLRGIPATCLVGSRTRRVFRR